MRVVEIRRYPVKSMLGETVRAARIGARGLTGDRGWAVRDPDGKLGSGKNTRRFRRMPGLFGFRAYGAGSGPVGPGGSSVPVVELPDGRRFAADDPAGHRAVGEVLGRPVVLVPEAEVPHHDEGPVSLLTTASLRTLSALSGGEPAGGESGGGESGGGESGGGESGGGRPGSGDVDAGRFRANLLLDVPGTGFPEDDWPGRRLRVGADVVLRIERPLTRCVMIDMAQGRAVARNDLLNLLTRQHDMTFGVLATVVRPGDVTTGDHCSWE